MDLIKRDYHIALFDIYKELLTAKQQEYFTLHYFEDFSFSEISEELNVSRNAPFDQIKKVVSLLLCLVMLFSTIFLCNNYNYQFIGEKHLDILYSCSV